MPLKNQDELKVQVAKAALAYIPSGQIIGIGTGSTVNKLIDELGRGIQEGGISISGAVSTSEASTQRLLEWGIPVFEANDVNSLPVYIDGADEIDAMGYMIKGGGGALTREKLVASLAHQFVCIADESKLVQTLGSFPLPVEVIPMAVNQIKRKFEEVGGKASLRLIEGCPFVTDNGQYILDVTGLQIQDPAAFELAANQWAGVLTVGVFAQQKANVCLLGSQRETRVLLF